MEVKQITNKSEWEQFVLSQSYTLFVQSSHYGEFYEALGEQSSILSVFDDDKLVGGSLVVSTHARRGDFLYLPYGPLGEGAEILFFYLKKFAKENKFDFIRCSPFWLLAGGGENILKQSGFRHAPMHILAENTWLLNLDKTEDELLAQMEKTHRYLIRRCEKGGGRVKKSTDQDVLEQFNNLHDETAKRHKFHRFSEGYIKKEFDAFAPHNETMIMNGYLPDGRLDSSAIIFFYGNMAAYRHGASLNLDNKLSTSYLVQWEAIKEAKRRGIKWYNFWGVIPAKAGKNHPFYGITHFKKGFGGAQMDLVRCHDLPISWRYWFNWIIETLRSLKRGFK
ncbi:peptidoglycan bridge formation glycyltransferase FemA/FemB family protein [Candidatus Peregrinibacteria bacterium]|nr:peptidoglycan bridge formation glycyltransferase FemA/FemB family protein [Candidatus Peregrinibacteria bacterium]